MKRHYSSNAANLLISSFYCLLQIMTYFMYLIRSNWLKNSTVFPLGLFKRVSNKKHNFLETQFFPKRKDDVIYLFRLKKTLCAQKTWMQTICPDLELSVSSPIGAGQGGCACSWCSSKWRNPAAPLSRPAPYLETAAHLCSATLSLEQNQNRSVMHPPFKCSQSVCVACLFNLQSTKFFYFFFLKNFFFYDLDDRDS